MFPVLAVVCGWIAAQPVICLAWAGLMRGRRAVGGN
jgi:hypothetical protein